MITITGLSFGFGLRLGTMNILRDSNFLEFPKYNKGCGLVLPFLPSMELYSKIASSKKFEFLIMPLCSAYSHFAANIWNYDLPTLAIQEVGRLSAGKVTLIDFDSGILLVAETTAEVNTLEDRLQTASLNTFTEETKNNVAVVSERIKILGEISSTEDILSISMADGDGFSVVKGEELFNSNANQNQIYEFIRVVKTNKRMLPLLIRFFDHEIGIANYPGDFILPSRYLGYRGIRILEIDDNWIKLFKEGLEMLDLNEIIIILPMVTAVTEVQRFRERIGPKWKQVGITVETPAAAIRIEELLDVSDFIEIGLNDLTQYTMAWDRDTPNSTRLPVDRIVEPVANLIESVVSASTSAGVQHTLGIDLRPSKSLATQIIQLGVKSISCRPSLIKPWINALSLVKK